MSKELLSEVEMSEVFEEIDETSMFPMHPLLPVILS